MIFSSLGDNMIDEDDLLAVTDSLQACDASESTLYSAAQFLDALYEPQHMTRSRAATPMIVWHILLCWVSFLLLELCRLTAI